MIVRQRKTIFVHYKMDYFDNAFTLSVTLVNAATANQNDSWDTKKSRPPTKY